MSIMPVAGPSFSWEEAAWAFAVIAASAFLVTWAVTDVARVRRAPYIGILTVVAVALAASYLAWSGTPAPGALTSRWAWGIGAGVVVAVIFARGVRRLPGGSRPTSDRIIPLLLWEGVVYGIAEGVLLSTLPVLAVWHAAADLGWTDGAWDKVGSGALAVAASLVVILVHHLGYREFRRSRRMLAMALLACGVQALAFLLTGSVLAPVIAHILLHAQLVLKGNELPPGSRPAPPLRDERPKVGTETRPLVGSGSSLDGRAR
jgi:hypothetical protein